MKVLMLGWEYPPHISGGLGTACEGLTKALSRQGVQIIFVVPKVFGDEDSSHMRIFSSDTFFKTKHKKNKKESELAQIVEIDSFLKPYLRPEIYSSKRSGQQISEEPVHISPSPVIEKKVHYGSDLFSEVGRYADDVSRIAENLDFDVIHAHDWMTYPAAMKIKSLTGKPVILHVHSLEFDRSGQNKNSSIFKIERLGLQSANHIVAVSHYTKSVVVKEHEVDPERIFVVHNGVTRSEGIQRYHLKKRGPKDQKIVLFLGRITYQKGPEYFVEAASLVIRYYKNVKFVMSGSGDMLETVKQLVCEKGIEDWFAFTGFLKGRQVEEMYSLADLYVMPSVSEPFGIAPLEAVACDTPLIISKQSGVSEVLSHALKVDFWDVHRLAELMLSVLENSCLSDELKNMAKRELLNIHWEAAANKTLEVYKSVLN